jgi:hypothetical protein
MTDLSLNGDQTPAAGCATRPTVTAAAVAEHLALSRTYVLKLVSERVIERLPDGRFDLDACRYAYLKWLRDPVRRSVRTEAEAAHVQAKVELLQVRLLEKRRTLVLREDVNELIDTIVGILLQHLSGMAARCTRDLVIRRNIDEVVLQIRREISEACSKMADERGEPPLDQQPGWHDR